MQLLDLPCELLLLIGENLSVKDLSRFLRANRHLSCLLTPHFHKLAVQAVGDLSALHWAARRGHAQLAELAISKGARVDELHTFGLGELPVSADFDDRNATPLDVAVYFNHPDVVRALIRHCAPSACWKFLLLRAATRESAQAIMALLELGVVDMTYTNRLGQTAAHISAIAGDIDSMRAFIGAGFDLRSVDPAGRTVLHAAVFGGEEMVGFLLAHGGEAIVDARDIIGETPLHLAATAYPPDGRIARLLLQHGADIGVKDIWGHTPMAWGAICGVSTLFPHADLSAKV